MRVSVEFSKHASSYELHNVIQDKVAKKLLENIDSKPQNILDLGCGSGAICKKIEWKYEHFTGIDFAPGMLELHPKSKKIEAIYGDFNDATLFENLQTYSYDYIFSASALQWSQNLEDTFAAISRFNVSIALAIFTANTFKTLNERAALKSLLRSSDEINELQKKYFDAKFEVVNYQLEFDSTREMFGYIKQSGVSGSRKVLSFKETKKLMNEYPLNYLEFEVAFIFSHVTK